MLKRLGIMLLFVATMMGDSDNLIVPIVLILTGAVMIFVDREEAENDR